MPSRLWIATDLSWRKHRKASHLSTCLLSSGTKSAKALSASQVFSGPSTTALQAFKGSLSLTAVIPHQQPECAFFWWLFSIFMCDCTANSSSQLYVSWYFNTASVLCQHKWEALWDYHKNASQIMLIVKFHKIMLALLTSSLWIKYVPNTFNVFKSFIIICSNKLAIFILLIQANVGLFIEWWRITRICSDKNKHEKTKVNIV